MTKTKVITDKYINLSDNLSTDQLLEIFNFLQKQKTFILILFKNDTRKLQQDAIYKYKCNFK